VRLYGRVQGVGFRDFARRAARDLDVAGYARNRSDGSVEVAAEASPEALARFFERLRHGPPYGSVQRMEDVALPEGEMPRPFVIRW
jgi:acylphosphatase